MKYLYLALGFTVVCLALIVAGKSPMIDFGDDDKVIVIVPDNYPRDKTLVALRGCKKSSDRRYDCTMRLEYREE